MTSFETSYARDFKKNRSALVNGCRPSTCGIHGHVRYYNDHQTTYMKEFPLRESDILPPAVRKSELHHVLTKHLNSGVCPSNLYDDESYRRAIRGKLNSTYRRDYLGFPQGTPLEINIGSDDVCPSSKKRSHVPHVQIIPEELRLPATRHGTNTDRSPARTAVPGCSCKLQPGTIAASSIYREDFGDWRYGPSVTISRSAKPHSSICPAVPDLFFTYKNTSNY